MGELLYATIASLDGYLEDAGGRFDWAMPDDEVFAAVNDLERSIGTYLYGRRLYQTMLPWESAPTGPDVPSVEREFAGLWRAAEKVVFSRTLQEVASARTQLERDFLPERIRELKRQSEGDLSVGGAELAGQALAAGLVDVCQVFLLPVAVGGGRPVFPLGFRQHLQLVRHRRFQGGAVQLDYRVVR